MKKNEQYIGTVEKMKFPNKGMVVVPEEEELVLVKNTLPGQSVRFTLTKKRAGKKEGRLEEVISPSSWEDGKAFCEHFEQCGGCAYQTLSYEVPV